MGWEQLDWRFVQVIGVALVIVSAGFYFRDLDWRSIGAWVAPNLSTVSPPEPVALRQDEALSETHFLFLLAWLIMHDARANYANQGAANHRTEPVVPIKTADLTDDQAAIVEELLTKDISANKLCTLLGGTRKTRLQQIKAIKDRIELREMIQAARERATHEDVPQMEPLPVA